MNITQSIVNIANYIADVVVSKLKTHDDRLDRLELGEAYPPVEIDGQLHSNFVDSNHTILGVNQQTLYPQGAYLTAINTKRKATLMAEVVIDTNTEQKYSAQNRAGIQAEILFDDGSRYWLQTFRTDENFRGVISETFTVPDGKTVQSIARVILVGNLPNSKSTRVGNPRLLI